MNNKPVIAVDVSKDSSHVQAFIEYEKKFKTILKIEHDCSGFHQLHQLIDELRIESGHDVEVVFEYTGVYDKALVKYLKDNNITCFAISPLQSANYRKLDTHANKTDKLDTTNIAGVYYNLKKLREFKVESVLYQKLKLLNRQYEDTMVHLRKYKVQFKSIMDVIFPTLVKKLGSIDVYNDLILEIIKIYPHPELLSKCNTNNCVKTFKKSGHSEKFLKKYLIKLRDMSLLLYSGVDKDNDIALNSITKCIENIQRMQNDLADLLKQIVELAKETKEFNLIVSIVGIGENLAARIIAELGDLSKFKNKSQVISYAGLDPMIRQSGQRKGEHLSITKKGNKYLRCLLYMAAVCNYRLAKDDPIYLFNQRKRQQSAPLKPKAANIAAAHKMLAMIFGMSLNNTEYIY